MKTLARLEHVLARAEWEDDSIREGLMCLDDGTVICGTMTNLFVVVKEKLQTPALNRAGVEGVMRRVVIEQARRIGFECAETDLGRDEVRRADELFLTNSLVGIWPIRRLADVDFKVTRVTRQLMAALGEIGVTECAP